MAIIETVIKEMHEHYNLPEVAAELEKMLRRNLGAGKYEPFAEPDSSVKRLTQDLRSISNDRHMGVWPYDPAYEDEELTNEQKEAVLAKQRRENFGFVQVRRLPKNIGYLELHCFVDAANILSALDFCRFRRLSMSCFPSWTSAVRIHSFVVMIFVVANTNGSLRLLRVRAGVTRASFNKWSI